MHHVPSNVLILSVALGAACVSLVPERASYDPPTTMAARFRQRAESGDPQSMVVLGYLLATGQGGSGDLGAARMWFGRSGELGHPVGHLNLAVLRYLGAGGERSVAGARSAFRRGAAALPGIGLRHVRDIEHLVAEACRTGVESDRGGEVFRTFCAGCHGATGVAVLDGAPSFALGERLDKDARDLIRTVEAGHADMPRWDDKLPSAWLQEAVAHARTLPRRFSYGLIRLGEVPEQYFSFGAMAGTNLTANQAETLRQACTDHGAATVSRGISPRSP